jgi:hypothetical protein
MPARSALIPRRHHPDTPVRSTLPTRLIALTLLLASGSASAQVELFNNGRAGPGNPGLSTGDRSVSNVAAPAGGLWSEAQAESSAWNAMAGFQCFSASASAALRLADDFAVPAGQTWNLSSVDLFAYARGVTSAPITMASVRIWSGPPGDAASTLLHDAVVSPSGSQATNLYRIFASTAHPLPQAPDATRRIWKVSLPLNGVELSSGTYWLDVRFAGPAAVFVPPVTRPGLRGVAGANAQQLRPGASAAEPYWAALADQGKPETATDIGQELPFIVYGTVGESCSLDYNRDGGTNLDDLGDFLTDFDFAPPIPGGLQPGAPTYTDRVVGYGVPCPEASGASPPYALDAYRQFGYRVAFSLPGTDPCPVSGPNTDHVNDFITAFWGAGCP